ncbi:MAG TPA: serine protease, partial [Phytomonospora sp.]
MTVPWTRRWAAGVVEVKKVRADGTKATYSGYVIADGLVLTAGHGLTTGDDVRVRPAPGGAWSDGNVTWRGERHDAALVTSAHAAAGPTVVQWGELTGRDPVPIRAYGFPLADDHDLTPLHGHAFPEGASRRGRLRVDVSGAIPAEVGGRPGWSGMSGAAILDEQDRLLGIIANVPANWRPDRLHAVPVTALLGDPGFRALTGADPARLEPSGDDCELVRPPHERFEWDTDDVSIAELLKARYAIVPFVPDGRETVLKDLIEWCRSEHSLAIRTLTGPAGTGKSRLAGELCRLLLEEPDTAWHAGFAIDPAASTVSWGEWNPRRATLIVFDYAGDLVWRDPFRRLFAHLRELRRSRRLRVPVRILLLSRQPPVDNLEDGSGNLRATLRLEHNRGVALPSLSLTPKARQDHLDTAFAAFTRPGSTRAVRPDVDGPAYDRP